MTIPLLGKFKAPKTDAHMLGPIQKIDFPMHRFSLDEEVDFCIVGVGSAGGVLLQRLARAGFRVVGIEAGPFGIRNAIGSAMRRVRPSCTGTSCVSRVEKTRSRLARIIVGGELVVVQCIGPDLHPAFIHRIFACTPKMV